MAAPSWLGVVCMFLNGFVMLTPHRIAMLCANHVIKRFHLPPATVSLFIYKIHNPMELSSLTSTFIAFTVSWITDAAFTDDTMKKKFQRIISCIAIWIMFLTSVVSYFMFISGDDYGNFESFYWSVVSITFANGFSSNFGFGVNFNSTMYGAGIPASSFVTFIVHKSYNYFYNKYFWDEYDYRLVVVQYYFTMFSLGLTGTLWTWDQMNEMKKDGGGGGDGGGGIVIDASVTPTDATAGKEALYGSGTNQITVTKLVGAQTNNPVPQDYVRYKHAPVDPVKTPNFTLSSVKHNDQELKDIVTGGQTPGVTAVYVYYHTNDSTKHEFPLIVCVKKSQSEQTYYKRGNEWKEEGSLSGINPEDPNSQADGLKTLGGKLGEVKGKFEIKLEKDNTINEGKYIARPGTEDTDKITVSPVDPDSGNKFKGFKHTLPNPANEKINRITIHGHVADGIGQTVLNTFTFGNGGGVYVYFEISNTNNTKPLLICLSDTGSQSSGNKWYKRQNGSSAGVYTWSEDPTGFSGKDPTRINELAQKIGEISGELTGDKGYIPLGYILKLDYVAKDTTNGIKYVTGDNDDPANRVITVNKDPGTNVPAGYVAHEHKCSGQLTDVKFRHNGADLPKVSTVDTIAANMKVWVFYQKDGQGNPKLETPLLLYFKKSGGNPEHNWYGKGMKWEHHSNLDVDASQNLPAKTDAGHNKIASKLNAISVQGKFLELLYFDNVDHWSPVLMLAFSLGTIYAFYPTISPYSLIDPERAERIDLWIVAICAMPNLGLAILDLEGVTLGPGKRWINYKQDYGFLPDKQNVNRQWYHYVWLGGIIYLICLYVFFSTLHFPDGWIGRHVKDNPYIVGFFGVTFNTIQELMESTGFGGGAVQSYEGFVGSINQFAVLLMLITCVCTMFPCDGYLKTIFIIIRYSYIILFHLRLQSLPSPLPLEVTITTFTSSTRRGGLLYSSPPPLP